MTEAKTAAGVEPATTKVEFVSPGQRSKSVSLVWPITVDGRLIESVTITRMTGHEVRKFMDAVAGGADVQMPPMFDISADVYDALDDDDRFALDEAAMDFLPRRLRMALEPTLPSGANTSAS